jgi:hypothetical protein
MQTYTEYDDVEFDWEYIGKFWVDFKYWTDCDCAGFNKDWIEITNISFNSEGVALYDNDIGQLKNELLEYVHEQSQGIDYSGRDWSKQADND